MTQALLVVVRFYEGRYHGTGDWPPAPARLFQALMAGAARGAMVPSDVRSALGWLERLPPPIIAAPHGFRGKAYTGFVPNNDLDAELSKKNMPDLDKAVAAVRVGKQLQPVLFDTKSPILYCWPVDAPDARATTLCATAEKLYQLGRGIDMAWAEAAVIDADEAEEQLAGHGGIVHRPSGGSGTERSFLCPRPGTGASLTERFESMRNRFRVGGTNRKPMRVFVQPPKPLLAKITYDARPHRLVFDLRKGTDTFAPWSLSAAAALVETVRDKAAVLFRDAVPDLADSIERYLVGRGATDADKAMRVRITPIPSVGHPDVVPAIRRVAVYVPQSCPLKADDLAWAFAQISWADGDGVIERELRRAGDDRMVDRFEQRGKRWRSVTPLALPMARRRRIEPTRRMDERKAGHERAAEDARAAAAVRQALRHAGIRAPADGVRVQREPFDRRGERAEAFASGTRFPKEALWHVEMTFAEPVAGPLVLGDGRYLGLGLMRPSDPARDVSAFVITDGLTDGTGPAPVAHAARRAMMARVQDSLPPREQLPSYVSGHAANGAPAGGGVHRHVAVLADLPRRRILYLAPNRMQRHGVKWQEIADDHRLMTRALEGMDILRAGQAGLLRLAPALVDEDGDPLFAPSRVWESVTEYDVTRHRRRLGDEEALKADVAAELRRCDWPILAPDAIEVLAARRGPRGGLAGRLRLVFPTAQAGPLVIGRSAHKGGGLFAGRPPDAVRPPRFLARE